MFDSVDVRSQFESEAPGALDLFEEALEVLESMVGTLEPGTLDGPEAAVGVTFFSALENIAAAGKALCAARLAQTYHWRALGDRTPAHWVARTTGCSMAEAMAATQVPGRLRQLPETDAGFAPAT